MPVTARTPRCGLTVGTVPSGTVDSNYPPTQFTVGELLFVPSGPSAGALYQLELSNAATPARFWFPVGTGGIASTVDATSPIYFAGGINGGAGGGGGSQGYLANDPTARASATPLRFRKSRPLNNVVVDRIRGYVSINSLTTKTALELYADGVFTGLSVTLNSASDPSPTGPFASPAGLGYVFADGTGFDIRLANVSGGSSNSIVLTVELNFGFA